MRGRESGARVQEVLGGRGTGRQGLGGREVGAWEGGVWQGGAWEGGEVMAGAGLALYPSQGPGTPPEGLLIRTWT